MKSPQGSPLMRAIQPELRPGEARKQATLDGITTAVAFVDRDLRILWTNRTVADSVGVTMEELVGRTCYSLRADQAQACAGCPMVEAFGTQRRAGTTMTPPGRTVWAETCEPVFDGNGDLAGVVMITRDITSQNRAEEQLHFQASLLAAVGEAVVATDVDGEVIYWNRAAERLYGWSAGEAIGRDITDLIVPDSAKEQGGEVQVELGKGKEWSGELQYQHRDGTLIPVIVTNTPVLGDDGGVIGIIGVFTDISERKRNEETGQGMLRRLQHLIGPEGCTSLTDKEIVDYGLEAGIDLTRSEYGFFGFIDNAEEQMTIHSWSTSALRECRIMEKPTVFGIEETGLWAEVVRNRMPLIVNDYAASHPEKRGTPEGHVPIRRFLGVPVFRGESIVAVAGFANRSNPYSEIDAHNVALLLHNLMHQIEVRLERHRLQRVEESARYAQHMESLGVLAGGVAHDFNNILGIITGLTDLALDKLEPSSRIHAYLKQILVATTRAAEMVDRILAFSRHAETERVVLDLGPLLQETLKLVRDMLPSSVVIRHEVAPGVPAVLVDPTQIQQVILNLCANANQAMPEGGELTLLLDGYEVSEAESSLYPNAMAGEHVLLVVRDTGVGMPPEILDRIFEPFFTTKGFGKGTGMGLASCHGIITDHGGFMVVESEVGVGSEFRVLLPSSELEAEEEAAEPQHSARGNEHILIIDDEQLFLTVATATLRSLGYRVSAFSSSLDAISALEQSPGDWDLVITDQTMPELDGVGVLCRARRLRSDLPVVIMTGHSDRLSDEADGGVGADAVIIKPFRRPQLAAILRRVLDGASRAQP